MGFKGSSVHTINDSGRISIPSKIRDVLRTGYSDETLVLALGRAFLAAYPTLEWEKYEKTLQENPPQTHEEAVEERNLYANLEEVSIDKQGRILIPPTLRAKAGLAGDCVIIGMNNRIEIWNKSRWDAEMSQELPAGGTTVGKQFNQLKL